MQTINVDLTRAGGKIKYMNAVNNGPVAPGGGVRQTPSNFELFKEAEISYARLHDSSFFTGYGGEFSVDVHRIFRNFDADENDPASYIFEPTDKYIANMINAGCKPFYRLGASIEHGYKFGTLPPADFAKWARICEHIILHYNEGWANGFHYGIEYWEIWNEPDTGYKQGNSPTWGGTMDEFFELFETSLYYLKEKFPHLKIGGPSLCSVTDSRDILEDMLTYLNRNGKKAPLDFFSWHMYGEDVNEFPRKIRLVDEILTEYGYGDIETILNEWNYVKSWVGEGYLYSRKASQGLKGASFVAGAMCVGQSEKLDMLMYYDARPTTWNGIFETGTYKPYKTYYAYTMFRDLLKLGTHVPTEYADDGVYNCVATDNNGSYGMMVTYFHDDDNAPPRDICIRFKNPSGRVRVEYRLLDENNNDKLSRSEIFTSEEFCTYLTMDVHSTYYISIKKI